MQYISLWIKMCAKCINSWESNAFGRVQVFSIFLEGVKALGCLNTDFCREDLHLLVKIGGCSRTWLKYQCLGCAVLNRGVRLKTKYATIFCIICSDRKVVIFLHYRVGQHQSCKVLLQPNLSMRVIRDLWNVVYIGKRRGPSIKPWGTPVPKDSQCNLDLTLKYSKG